MLVLSRKVGEKICINDDIVLTVLRLQHDKVRIGIEAPRKVSPSTGTKSSYESTSSLTATAEAGHPARHSSPLSTKCRVVIS